MKILHTDIVDSHDPRVNSGQSRFITSGLGLEVDWENTVKQAVVIDNGDKNAVDASIASVINKNYNYIVMPSVKSTWDVKSKVHIISGTDTEIINNIKNMRHTMNHRDLCQVLNHAQVWNYCVKLQQPVIIIEAGTLLNTRVQRHVPRNSIINLTNNPLKQINQNWHSFQAVQCYCVDQFVSRQLLTLLYTQGIRDKLSTIIRDDLFCIW